MFLKGGSNVELLVNLYYKRFLKKDTIMFLKAEALEPCLAIREGGNLGATTTRRCNIGEETSEALYVIT